jgi:uncharacterized RDD family membrane protein YckC
MTNENYPGIFDRMKASMVDGIVIIIFMVVISAIFSFFETVPDNARIIAFVFIFLLYDPLFTSIFGGTIGHMMIGIRVRRDSNEQKNIILPLAIPRYIVKVTLGWISLITVSTNVKRKAIHDYLVGSVVIYSKPINNQIDEI